MSLGQEVNYDSNPSLGGIDKISLSNLDGVTLNAASTTYSSQATNTHAYRTATVKIIQYASGVVTTQGNTWSVQLSPNGSTWYTLTEVYGTAAPQKAITGTAALPAIQSYPVPICAPSMRVQAVSNAICDATHTITIVDAGLVLSPITMIY